MSLTSSAILSGFFDYLFIFIFCLLGAVTNDTYNTLTKKDYKVKVARIMVSTLVSSILIFSLSDYILKKISWKVLILPCFIGGMLGFSLMGRITKLSFWINIIKKNKDSILKDLENELLNLDEVLKPLQSAYTQSGKTNAITAAATKAANAQEKIENKQETEDKKDEEEKNKEEDKGGGE